MNQISCYDPSCYILLKHEWFFLHVSKYMSMLYVYISLCVITFCVLLRLRVSYVIPANKSLLSEEGQENVFINQSTVPSYLVYPVCPLQSGELI